MTSSQRAIGSTDANGGERWTPSLVGSMLRYWKSIAAAVLVVGGLSYALAAQSPTRYTAQARIFLDTDSPNALLAKSSGVDPERYILQQVRRLRSSEVMTLASQTIPDSDPATLPGRVEGSADIELGMITVTATTTSGERSALIANEVAAAYQTVSAADRLSNAQTAASELDDLADEFADQIAELQVQIAAGEGNTDLLREQLNVLVQQQLDISSRSQQLVVDARVYGSGIAFIEPANAPLEPSSAPPYQAAVLAALMAGGLAAAAAYWRAGRSAIATSAEQVAEVLGVPLLGVLPLYRRRNESSLLDRLELPIEVQEAYNFLFAALEHELGRMEASSFLLTSARPKDGKSEVAIQLASSALFHDRRTVLVDGDLHVRSLTQLAGLGAQPGMTDLGAGVEDGSQLVRALEFFEGVAPMRLLPAGREVRETLSVLRRPALARELKALGDENQLVIVDSPPLLASADTPTLARHVDAVVLVIRHGVSMHDLEALAQRLTFVPTPVVGFVFITPDQTARVGTYGSGYTRSARQRGPGEVSAVDTAPVIGSGVVMLRGSKPGPASRMPWRRSESRP